MKKLFLLSVAIVFIAGMTGCGSKVFSPEQLEKELKEYVKNKDCRIGVAVIYGCDTIGVTADEAFPMLSVYKFPQAIAVGRICSERGMTPDDSINISGAEILAETYSPMRERYGREDISLPLGELLGYTLMMSDNNACDILFRVIGGVSVADSVIKSMGFDGISIANTEEEMNASPKLCYANSATPKALAGLFAAFHDSIGSEGEWMRTIKAYLEMCQTGMARIPGANFDSETLIGRKTGTGPKDDNGRIIAVNDAGYVEFSSGDSYSIVVMVSQSPMSLEDTEEIIGDISEIVRHNIEGKR